MFEKFVIAIMLIVAISWLVNLYKFCSCDFSSETPIKAEIVHGIGLVPAVSVVTAWLDVGK